MRQRTGGPRPAPASPAADTTIGRQPSTHLVLPGRNGTEEVTPASWRWREHHKRWGGRQAVRRRTLTGVAS